jgi:hypothetical protein
MLRAAAAPVPGARVDCGGSLVPPLGPGTLPTPSPSIMYLPLELQGYFKEAMRQSADFFEAISTGVQLIRRWWARGY